MQGITCRGDDDYFDCGDRTDVQRVDPQFIDALVPLPGAAKIRGHDCRGREYGERGQLLIEVRKHRSLLDVAVDDETQLEGISEGDAGRVEPCRQRWLGGPR